MTLINSKDYKLYNSVYDFISINKIGLIKLIKIFGNEYTPKNNFIDNDDYINYLLDCGLNDTEIIEKILKNSKKKYLFQYIDIDNGYFLVSELV